VDDDVDVVRHGGFERRRIQDVSPVRVAAASLDQTFPLVIADESGHIVATVGEQLDDSLPEDAGGAGDEYLHHERSFVATHRIAAAGIARVV